MDKLGESKKTLVQVDLNTRKDLIIAGNFEIKSYNETIKMLLKFFFDHEDIRRKEADERLKSG